MFDGSDRTEDTQEGEARESREDAVRRERETDIPKLLGRTQAVQTVDQHLTDCA
jgi:hypothetical protein